MQFKRVFNLLILAAMALCFISAATAADADGWYPAPVTQTVYYPQPTTVYYAQPATAMGTSSTPVYTERKYWVAKPVTETTQHEEKVIVRKPVVETVEHEEKYIVRKPVIETSQREETRTVWKPVVETAEHEQRVIVQRPVYETATQTSYVTQYTPMTAYQPVYLGWGRWGQQATTYYAPQVTAVQSPVQTVRYQSQEEVPKCRSPRHATSPSNKRTRFQSPVRRGSKKSTHVPFRKLWSAIRNRKKPVASRSRQRKPSGKNERN